MRHPSYETLSQRLALVEAARSWIGTPFRKGVAVKGAGVDCVHLAHSVYLESGCILPTLDETYSLDGGRHLRVSKVVQWLERSGRFQKVDEHLIGDLLLFKIGYVVHHVGIKITAATFINAIKHHGVRELNVYDSTWNKRLVAIYRPMEPSQ